MWEDGKYLGGGAEGQVLMNVVAKLVPESFNTYIAFHTDVWFNAVIVQCVIGVFLGRPEPVDLQRTYI